MPEILDPRDGPLYPQWLKPENASVLDPSYRAPLREIVSLLGLDDPAQILALATAMPVGKMAGGVVDAVAKRLPRFARAIKAYHGSPHDFEAFDLAKAGTTTDAGQMGKALYFGTDPRVAANAAHKYEVKISAKNPLTVSMPDWRTYKGDVVTETLGLPKGSSADDIAKAARSRGHDAIEMDYSPAGYQHKEIAVFDDKLVEIVRKYVIAGLTIDAAIQKAQAERQSQMGAMR